MKLMKKRADCFVGGLLAVTTVLLVCFSILTASTPSLASDISDSSDCAKCHSSYVADFILSPDLKVRRLADFDANGNVIEYSACWVCHKDGYHGLARSNRVFVPGSGFFNKTANQSVYSSPEVLHFVHDGYNGGKNTAATASCATRCHGNVSCNACHEQVSHVSHGLSSFEASYIAAADGVNYVTRNMNCTISECHQKMPAVKRVNTDGTSLCVNCHPRFGASAIDANGHSQEATNLAHEAPLTDTIIHSGVPETLTCQGCHDRNLVVEHNNKGKECTVCHNPEEPIPANVKNIVTSANGDLNARGCTECHFNSEVLVLPTEHRFYHIANGSSNLNLVGGPHASCDTCHGNQSLWPTIDKLAQQVTKNYSCLDCHNETNSLAPKHMALFDGDNTEITQFHMGCKSCHEPGSDAATNVNSILTNLDNGAENYSCVDCHNGDNLDEAHVGVIDGNCTTYCHNSSLIDEHLSANSIGQQVNDGALTCGSCHTSQDSLVRAAITSADTNCVSCHTQAHDLNISHVPGDIPLYPGYQWSIPQMAEIWAGEPWMPEGYEGARLLISNRLIEVVAEDVWSFYKEQMVLNGWTVQGDDPKILQNSFNAEFVKDKRKVTVFFYGGADHNSTPVVSSGYRLEILYK